MKYITLVSFLFLAVVQPAHAIKKCKDADGKWHYGDTAVATCKNSKVTTLNDRGFVTDELAAPKTAEERAAEEEVLKKEEMAEAKKRAEEEERLRVLNIYESESDIERQRDNQINSVQSNIDVHEAAIKNMETRIAGYERKLEKARAPKAKQRITENITETQARMKLYEDELIELQKQKDAINVKFESERDIFRRYTQLDQ